MFLDTLFHAVGKVVEDLYPAPVARITIFLILPLPSDLAAFISLYSMQTLHQVPYHS